jgi:Rrf2 family protein
MKRDGKLSLALHALGHMAAAETGAQGEGRPLRSEDMAAHNGTNAVVVRRVLGRLREAGIVRSEKGHAGGWRLARDPAAVTVAEVQEALGEGLLAHRLAGDGGPTTCIIERALHEAVDAALRDAEALLLGRLARVTVADLARGMAAPEGTSGFAPKDDAEA